MEERSGVDGRLAKFGRVTPIYVEGSHEVLRDRESRASLLTRCPPEVDGRRVLKPGFKDIVSGKERLLSAYIFEEKKSILTEEGPEDTWEMQKRMVFDLLAPNGKGWIILQGGNTRVALERLKIYLAAFGLEAKSVAAVPLTVPDQAIKTISESNESTLTGFRGGKSSDISMSTRLPGLANEKHYQAVTGSGIHHEPWKNCQIRPPYLATSGMDPPRVTIHPNGFSIGTDYRETGTWVYVDWAIRTIESASAVPVTRKGRMRSLSEFGGDDKGTRARMGSESGP